MLCRSDRGAKGERCSSLLVGVVAEEDVEEKDSEEECVETVV